MLAAWSLLALVGAGRVSAQTGNTGVIEGRVLNVTSNRYVNNARITVEGTDRTTFTDEFGDFRIVGAPAGEVRLRVFYTGLAEQLVPVSVAAGQTATVEVRLTSTALAPGAGEAVQLDAFQVTSARETNAASLAINEQRFAPNLKTVVATDAFGDVAEGNVGEFAKFLPGVTVDYTAADVRSIAVRGFGSNFTAVSVDGGRMASAGSGNAIRTFELEQVSINNVARVEVSKVPTPDMPSDSLGGSVNMVSKNAFERAKAQLNYRAYLSLNSENLNIFSRTPGPYNEDTYKALPNFDFDYTLPVNRNFGLVITGLTSNQFNEQHRTRNVWNFVQAGATPNNPYLQQYLFQDGPKNTYRSSVSLKADWKAAPGHVLSAGYQFNYYKNRFGNRNVTWDVGTNPAATGGTTPLTWGPDFTSGASGRGSVRHGTSFRDKLGATNAANLKYRFTGRRWSADAGLDYSVSKSWYRDLGKGHYEEVRTTLQGVSRVAFDNIQTPRPMGFRALTTAGAEVDHTTLANYRINTVRSRPLDASDQFRSARGSVKRHLDFLPFEASLQVGGEIRKQTRDIRRYDTIWTFVGTDRTANTADDNAAAYLDASYGAYPYWGLPDVQWPDPFALASAIAANPSLVSMTADQARNSERFRIQNSQLLNETVSAAYVRADAKLFRNRLAITTGVRFEHTDDDGRGPLTPGPGLTLTDVQTRWRERGLAVEKSYDGYYPSLNATWNVGEDLIARFGYAKTLGRPDFGNILPLVRINDTTTAQDDGVGTIEPQTIIYNNTGLQPYEADNYDVSLEYYFKSGGVLSGGLFRKDLTNFFLNDSRAASAADLAALNLDPAYAGFNLQTKVNSSRPARVTGAELNFRLPLNFIPTIGQYMTIFANGTKLDLDGPASADFLGFIPASANWGIAFSKKPYVVRLNWNHRGRQLTAPQTGGQYGATNGFNEYSIPRTTLDLSAEYAFTRRITAFAGVRNVFNVPQTLERSNAVSPAYSRFYNREMFGVQISLGVKGTF